MEILADTFAAALRDPRWGVCFGRKCCLPASPVLAAPPGDPAGVWRQLLRRAGLTGSETIEQFVRVMEVLATDPGSELIGDGPLGYGRPIGERHAPRWIRRLPKSAIEKGSTST